MSGLAVEADIFYNSKLADVLDNNSVISSLEKLEITTVKELVTYFPKRYINLSGCVPISNTTINEKNVICGEVYEVKERKHDDKTVLDVTCKDKTGVILFTIYDRKQALEIVEGTFIVVSGDVYFDYGFKRIANPLIVNASSLVKSGILPVYETRFVCEQLVVRETLRQTIYRLEYLESVYDKCHTFSMTYAQALRSIHFARDVDNLKQAILRIKIEELANCNMGAIERIITGEFPVKSSLDARITKKVSPFCMDDLGDALDNARSSLEKDAKVYILCPLAGLNSLDRNKMSFAGANEEITRAKYYPRICIESVSDLKPYAGMHEIFRRKQYFAGILNTNDSSIFSSDDMSKIKGIKENDCLIIEDADRYSLLVLFQITCVFPCDVVLLSRSKRTEAISRLNKLNEAKSYAELLNEELGSRYPGDILGNRVDGLEDLKLVNLHKDRDLIEKVAKMKSHD